MSARYFCDVCEKEIVDRHDRVRRQLGKVMVEVMIRFENTWNAGHVCDACVLQAVNEGRACTDG